MLLVISDCMRYFHENQITHRDFNPENVLIDSDFCPQICDFGLSNCFFEQFSQSLELIMTGQICTPLYMSQELLKCEEHYGPSVDVFAFSIFVYQIVTRKNTYHEVGDKILPISLNNKIINCYRPQFNERVSD